MRHRIKRVHFVGIGGAGMSGIAEVMSTLGYRVSGSDLADGENCRALRRRGVKVHVGHSAAHADGADAVVFSSAVAADNPELAAARRKGIPVVPRATMLAELLRLRQGVAVAGTHGKTTITSLVAHILHEAGMDPTFIVGGVIRRLGSSRLGSGEFIIVEADESDASFLAFRPVVSVVSNIDTDHLQAYGQDFARLKRAFVQFIENLPFYGVAVVCVDDPNARSCAGMCSKRVLSYGISSRDADFRAGAIRARGELMSFRLRGPVSGAFEVRARGVHNVLNTLAAIAVAHELGVSKAGIRRALRSFQGVARRIEDHGELALGGRRFVLVDDYGHHPTEMEATIGAVRAAWPGRRLVVVFQPHRYSRTRDTFEGLAAALGKADLLVLTEVYPAGEEPIPAASGEALARAIRLRGEVEPVFVPGIGEAAERLGPLVEDGDLVLTLGAGSVGRLPGIIREMCDR